MQIELSDEEVKSLVETGGVKKYVSDFVRGSSLATFMSDGRLHTWNPGLRYRGHAEKKEGLSGRCNYMTLKIPLVPMSYSFPAKKPGQKNPATNFWCFELRLNSFVRDRLRAMERSESPTAYEDNKRAVEEFVATGKKEEPKKRSRGRQKKDV